MPFFRPQLTLHSPGLQFLTLLWPTCTESAVISLLHHNADLCLPGQGLPRRTDELRTGGHTQELKPLSHTDVALTTKASHPQQRGGEALLRCRCHTNNGRLHRERSPSHHSRPQPKNPTDTRTSSGEPSALTFLFLAAQGLGTNGV